MTLAALVSAGHVSFSKLSVSRVLQRQRPLAVGILPFKEKGDFSSVRVTGLERRPCQFL